MLVHPLLIKVVCYNAQMTRFGRIPSSEQHMLRFGRAADSEHLLRFNKRSLGGDSNAEDDEEEEEEGELFFSK